MMLWRSMSSRLCSRTGAPQSLSLGQTFLRSVPARHSRSISSPLRDPSVLMLEGGRRESQVELLLQAADFPKNYVNMAHPEDFVESEFAIDPTILDFEGHYGHHRLIFRVSFLKSNGNYVPLSFVVDTGAPFHFYLSSRATETLEDSGRLLTDGAGQEYMRILDQNVVVHETPHSHQPGNILGLKMIRNLQGLKVDERGFSFAKPFVHF